MGLMRLLLLLSKYQNLKTGPVSDKIYVIPYIKTLQSCLWRAANCFKNLFIALITANGMKDFRAWLVNKDRRPLFSIKILLNCLGETQFYTSS